MICYTYRWRIERFHFTLKSGGNDEKLQLQTADRLWRAFATYLVVAWRVLYIDPCAPRAPQWTLRQMRRRESWTGRGVIPAARSAEDPERTIVRARW